MTKKSKIRLVHTSDLHLGEEDRSPLTERHLGLERDKAALIDLVSIALLWQADLVVIAGDVFDNNRVGNGVVELVRKELRNLPVPIVMLPGNHDCLIPESVYRREHFFRDTKNLFVFSQLQGHTFSFPDLDLAIWGKPVDNYGASPTRPLISVPPRGRERWQIAVAHGHYVDKRRDSSYSLQIFDDDIRRSDRDYIALGHWDVFSDVSHGRTKACYSGSLSRFGQAALVELDPDQGASVLQYSARIKGANNQ